MADVQDVEPDLAESAPVETPVAKPVRSKKKLMVIVAAAAVLLIGGAGAAYAFMGEGEASSAEGGHGGESADPKTFVDIPPMTVNLRSADGTPRFLRVHLMLVPGSAGGKEELEQKLPLIIDAYQPFLRELRPEDLAGSAAAFRLKEEMLIRANREAGDGSVSDVLIQDLVQQ